MEIFDEKFEKAIQADISLIGAAMHNPESIAELVRAEPGHFIDYDTKTAWMALCEAFDRGLACDPITVSQKLTKAPQSAPNWLSFLTQCMTSCPSARNLGVYNTLVRESGMKRQLKIDLARVFAALDEGSLDEQKAAISSVLDGIDIGGSASSVLTIEQCIHNFIEDVEARAEGKIPRFYSGIEALDAKIECFEPSDLIVVAARPGMGKTAMTLQMAAEMALQGPVIYYSLEMSDKKLVTRLMANYAGMDMRYAKSPDMSNECQIDRIVTGAAALQKRQLMVCHKAGTTIQEIKAQARKQKRTGGLHAIFVDYLELMRGYEGVQGIRTDERLGMYTKDLKALAKELEIPVILLCQLNRGVEGRTERRPLLSDLRNSGEIEQDCDFVMMLYREDYYQREKRDIDVCEVILTKNRQGEQGTIYLNFNAPRQRFEDCSEDFVQDYLCSIRPATEKKNSSVRGMVLN
jgi:replicative DNA helicase